jgi:hypothetical protein
MTFEEWLSVGDESGESGWVEHSAEELAKAAWQAAYRAGQEDMRERALCALNRLIKGGGLLGSDGVWVHDAEEAIRALEIKGE